VGIRHLGAGPVISVRDDHRGAAVPLVTAAVIALCTLVFLWQLSLGRDELRELIYRYGAIPALLFGRARLSWTLFAPPKAVVMVSTMFLHANLLHLGSNMIYLWIFGKNIEAAMGRLRFALFYLACGVMGTLAYALFDPHSRVPVIGASGAISGVLGAYLLLFPYARVLIFLPLGRWSRIIRLPAFWVLWFWFIYQLMSLTLSDGQGSGVAWIAHVGGFVAGMMLIPVFKHRGVRLMQPRHGSRRWHRRF
jgi:membrane associated rhomboid family serine protease